MRTWATTARAAGASLVLLCVSGCADMSYYWQSARGHLQLMHAARPIQDWLDDAKAPPELKRQLELARRLRAFAVDALHLPDNASYHRYADLGRRAAVWNAIAAPPYSLKLKTWCFPFTGCIGYRGYFDEREAQALAAQLRSDGLEASVYGVPAYSTLGWMNWLGGDPLLNTFIQYPEGELARMLFHELAHQMVYVQDDTQFNESFATAVERLGSAQWLATHASEAARVEYARFDSRRREFRALMLATRKQLEAVYADGANAQPMAERKAQVMEAFRTDYALLKRERWQGFAGYDAYVERVNNASFGVQAAYDGLVPAFEALFEREGRDWPRFYAAVRSLAARSKAERDLALGLLAPLSGPAAGT
ncbi:aminopeptidase [Pseudorhodoferax sp. Leaf267]|nr:aminopeptidase [Pseudorhodoferax sp. Leaf267]